MRYIYQVFDLSSKECVAYTNKIKNAAKKVGVCPHTLSRALIYHDGYFLWNKFRIIKKDLNEEAN